MSSNKIYLCKIAILMIFLVVANVLWVRCVHHIYYMQYVQVESVQMAFFYLFYSYGIHIINKKVRLRRLRTVNAHNIILYLIVQLMVCLPYLLKYELLHLWIMYLFLRLYYTLSTSLYDVVVNLYNHTHCLKL